MEIPGNVQVWWLTVDAEAHRCRDRLLAMLDAGEQARAAGFRLPCKRLEYISAHALVRGLLSSRTGISPQAWRFCAEPGGRPELEAGSGFPRLRVSLSHTRGLAIAAVAQDHAVGIDAERLGRERSIEGLLKFFCSPAEMGQLAATQEVQRMRAGLALWTLKEAYGKAVGKGLSYPLTSHGFSLMPPALVETPEGDGAGWLFRTLNPTPAHVAALAVHHGDNRAPSVSVRPADLPGLLSFSGASGKP